MPLPLQASAKLNWNSFLPDLILLLLYFFCLHPLMAWQQQHLSLSCTLLILLNIFAVGLGCFTFFTAFADRVALVKYKNGLSKFESAALGIAAFISCFAFFWWLVPFAAVKQMGVNYSGFIPGAGAYFIIFMAVVAGSINNKNGIKIANSGLLKITSGIVIIVFFFFSYAFLLLTMQNWESQIIAAPFLAILCLFVFYLPLRFFLLLRPPFSKLEYISFLFSFGFLMFELFVKL